MLPFSHCSPVRLCCGGCSFQFGRASDRSCRFDVVDIGVPNENCYAIPFPYFVVEFCARRMFNDCSVRVERSQPPFSGLIEAWFQNLKGKIGNAAPDAVATISHEK
jgi:hypothetical protein